MDKHFSILFVCKANRFRSPIAEAVFRKLIKEHGIENDWIVASAGTWTFPGLPHFPFPKKFLDDLGLDLSEHHSLPVNQEMLGQFDLIIVMEKGQKEALSIEYPEINQKVFMLTEFSNGIAYDIPDPVGVTENNKTEVVTEIIRLVTDSFQEICDRVAVNHSMKNLNNDMDE
jgi:protein-tyrosine-phosphatase